MILIIDNRSTFIKIFQKTRLIPSGVPYVMVRHNKPLPQEVFQAATGLILSGGKGTPWSPLVLTADFQALMNLDVPTIGICLGHEILAVAHAGRIGPMPAKRQKWSWVDILESDDPIFSGLDKEKIRIRMQHHHQVSELPPEFRRIGSSAGCSLEIIRHQEKPIYGFQGHPEVSGSDGWIILRNFFAMCGHGVGA